MASFQMGPQTFSVPMSLFEKNRQRLCSALKTGAIADKGKGTFVLLEGGKDVSFNDTDVDFLFRQESFFQWCFGVKEPSCFGVINVDTCESVLFVPRLPEEYATWMGRLLSLSEFMSMYEVNKVFYVDELDHYFQSVTPKLILTLNGQNSDSKLYSKPASFEGIEKYIVNCDILHPIISECRVTKTAEEIEVLRYVAKISSDAHIKVMKFMRPGRSEYEGEAVFLHHTYGVGGCRHTSYTCICGTGINSAILHYGHAAAPNNKAVRNGDMCLFDMGANYAGYAADITCSFPANGKFTEDQKYIYNAVLDARNAVLLEAKDGVSWIDMHRLACRVLLTRLKEGGMLIGEVDEMLSAGLAGYFQPHGLGHLIGLDVHDVGGYLPGQPERPSEPWLSKLRFARVLKDGMYVTVEPGCYFIDSLMDKVLADPALNQYINKEVFERFRNFGGVRIEDDVLITKNGNENFAVVPRSIEEIEKCMAQKE